MSRSFKEKGWNVPAERRWRRGQMFLILHAGLRDGSPELPAWLRGRSGSRKHRPSVPQAKPAWRRRPFSEFSALFEAKTDTFQTLLGPTPISTGRNVRLCSSEIKSQPGLPWRVWKKQLTFISTDLNADGVITLQLFHQQSLQHIKSQFASGDVGGARAATRQAPDLCFSSV